MASSIPPLIPVPTPESEEMIDRFAILFSPPAPRASLTNTPPPSTFPTLTDSPRSRDGEFRAFISMPPSQDPLATILFSPVDTEPHTTHVFFDEAKRGLERNKRDVLDVLLLDEPLFRSKEPPLPPPPPPIEIDTTSDTTFFSAKPPVSLPPWYPSHPHLDTGTPHPPAHSHSQQQCAPPHMPPSTPSSTTTTPTQPRPAHIPLSLSRSPMKHPSHNTAVPPRRTGAQGYHGEGYDWDKDFSKDLEREGTGE